MSDENEDDVMRYWRERAIRHSKAWGLTEAQMTTLLDVMQYPQKAAAELEALRNENARLRARLDPAFYYDRKSSD